MDQLDRPFDDRELEQLIRLHQDQSWGVGVYRIRKLPREEGEGWRLEQGILHKGQRAWRVLFYSRNQMSVAEALWRRTRAAPPSPTKPLRATARASGCTTPPPAPTAPAVAPPPPPSLLDRIAELRASIEAKARAGKRGKK